MNASKFRWPVLMLYIGCVLFIAHKGVFVSPLPSFLAYSCAQISLLVLVLIIR